MQQLAREQRRLASLLLNPKEPVTAGVKKSPKQLYAAAFAAHLQRWQSEGEYYPQPTPSDSPATLASKETTQTVPKELPEERAAAKLKLARTLAIGGHQTDAREYLEGIVANYAGTAAAAEAQRLLDSSTALWEFGKDR